MTRRYKTPARDGFYVVSPSIGLESRFFFSLLAVETTTTVSNRVIDTAMEMFLRLGSCKFEYASARKKNDISRVIG